MMNFVLLYSANQFLTAKLVNHTSNVCSADVYAYFLNLVRISLAIITVWSKYGSLLMKLACIRMSFVILELVEPVVLVATVTL